MPRSASAIRAARAYVEFFVSSDKLTKGLAAVKARLNKISAWSADAARRVGLATAAVAAPLTAAVRQFTQLGSDAYFAAQRLGTTADEWTRLAYAAEQTGVETEALQRGLLRLGGLLDDAKQGGEGARKAFTRLGLDWEALSQMPLSERVLAVADALQRLPDAGAQFAAASDLFGTRAAQGLLPLLLTGRGEIESLLATAAQVGAQITQEQARQAKQLGDAWTDAKKAVAGAAVSLGSALAPALRGVSSLVMKAAQSLSDWMTRNQHIVLGVGAVTAAITGLAIALKAVSIAATVSAAIISGAMMTIAAIALVIKGIMLIITAPITALVAALAAVGAAILAWYAVSSGVFQRLSTNVGRWFGDLFARVQQTWGAIIALVKAGDLETAIELALAWIQVAWRQATRDIVDQGSKLIVDLMTSFQRLQEFFQNLEFAIQSIVARVFNFATPRIKSLIGILKQLTDIAEWLGVWGARTAGITLDMIEQIVDVQAGITPEQLEQQRQEAQARMHEEHAEAEAGWWRWRMGLVEGWDKAIEENKANLKQVQAKVWDRLWDVAGAGFPDAAAAAAAAAAEEAENEGQPPEPLLAQAAFGTFSAAAAGRLGAGGIIALQREANDILRRIDDRLEDIARRDPLAFGQ